MRRSTRRLAGSLLLLAATSLSGCALFGGHDATDAEPDPALIARNLLHTLAQLPELDPDATTVQASTPSTAFGREVIGSLEAAGYGIREVTADQGSHYVRYRAERAETETGERTRYRLAIGDVAIERDYRVVDGRTLPDSAQEIIGSEEREVALNDELFADAPPASLSTARFEPGMLPTVIDLTVAPVEPELSAASIAAAVSPERQPPGPQALVRRNMYETQRSNYAPLLAEYEDVRQDTLIFANDSLVLGEANKRLIADYARDVDPETDVLSVIGCSHGGTAIDNGNEVLAVGRANRVKEAFVFAGISQQEVLEESCWAGDHHEVFPKRGVVLTLKRRRDG